MSRLRGDDGGEEKFFFNVLSNSVRPFDYMVKAGQPARPKTKKIKTVTGEKKSHATVSGVANYLADDSDAFAVTP